MFPNAPERRSDDRSVQDRSEIPIIDRCRFGVGATVSIIPWSVVGVSNRPTACSGHNDAREGLPQSGLP